MEFVAAIAVFVAVFCLAFSLITHNNSEKRDRAFERANQVCGHQVESYDIEGQNRIVYSCETGALRTLPY